MIKAYISGLALSILAACSGSTSNRDEDQAVNPDVMTPSEVAQCEDLFQKSQDNPTLFHSASPACQRFAANIYLSTVDNFLAQQHWLNEGFGIYLIKERIGITLSYDKECLIPDFRGVFACAEDKTSTKCVEAEKRKKDCDALRLKLGESLKDEYCVAKKVEYLERLDQLVANLAKARVLHDTRVPLMVGNPHYLEMQKSFSGYIAAIRQDAEKTSCEKGKASEKQVIYH